MKDMTLAIIYTFIRAKFDKAFMKLQEFFGAFEVIDTLFLEITNDFSSIKRIINISELQEIDFYHDLDQTGLLEHEVYL